jgi:hypothetical protein
MPLPGSGCFVAWYDVNAGCEAEHDRWHAREHMIERVSIPGFLSGRRYSVVGAGPRTCVIYLARDVETFTSDAYAERLNNPSEWTMRVMPTVVGMNRTLCRVRHSLGTGMGGYLLTAQIEPADPVRLEGVLVVRLMPELASLSGICGVHLMSADQAASHQGSQEKSIRGAPDAVADWVLLVEAYEPGALAEARTDFLDPALEAAGLSRTTSTHIYRLDFTLNQDELAFSQARRRGKAEG